MNMQIIEYKMPKYALCAFLCLILSACQQVGSVKSLAKPADNALQYAPQVAQDAAKYTGNLLIFFDKSSDVTSKLSSAIEHRGDVVIYTYKHINAIAIKPKMDRPMAQIIEHYQAMAGVLAVHQDQLTQLD